MDLFKSADPWQGGARQTTVVDALAEGVKQVNAGRVADPVIASTLRRTIATVYAGLGRNAEADTLYRETLRERLARTGPLSEDAAQSWNDLGTMLTSQGKFDSAETALDRALEIRRRHGADTVLAANLLDLADLATITGPAPPRGLARPGGARDLPADGRRARLRRGDGHGPGRFHPGHGAGELAKAESTGRATVAMLRELGRSGTRSRSRSSVTWRSFSRTRGEYPEALAIGRQTVSLDSSLFGTSHPSLATHLENLGYVYNQAGFPDSAIVMVKQVLAMRRALLAADNPAIGRTLYNLASLESEAGAYDAAQPHYEEAARLMRRAYGPEHPDVVTATGWLGRNQFELGQYAESERNIRSALAVTAPNAVTVRDSVRFGRFLVTMLVDQRRWREAEPLALRVFAIQDSLQEHAGPGDGGAARRDLRRDGAEGAGGGVSGAAVAAR